MADIHQDALNLDEALKKLDEMGKETPTESPTETNKAENAPSSQGAEEKPKETEAAPNTENENNLPFNKHPRWKQMQEERDQLRQKVDELESNLHSVADRIPQVDTTIEVPTWFQMAVSNDPAVWKEYKKYSVQEREEIKRELLQEQTTALQREQQEMARWTKYVDDSLAKIEDTYSIDLSTKHGEDVKNEFLEFIHKRKPTDDQGNIDFMNGWQWFQEIKKAQPERTAAKKTVASMSDSSGSSDRSTSRESVSREDLRGRSWRDFI